MKQIKDTSVTLSDNQIITGTKTFNHIKTTANIHTYANGRLIERRDSNDKSVSTLESFVKDDGIRTTALFCFKDDGTTNGNLMLSWNNDDKFVIKPSSAYEIYDNSNSLTTTKWCRDNLASLKETYSNGTEWYRVWNDGWIEQGGFSVNNAYVVTFLKPFSNANYTAVCTFQDGYSSNSLAINARTNTGFQINRGTAATDIGSKAWHACGF